MRRLLLLLALTAAASRLPAQRAELTAFSGLSQVSDNDLGAYAGRPLRLENGFRGGVRFALNSGVLFGHEWTYGYERHDLDYRDSKAKATVHEASYNLVLHLTPRAGAIRPFVAAGVGVAAFRLNQKGPLERLGNSTNLGVNFGGGLKIRMSRMAGLRLDIRDHLTGKPAFKALPPLDGRLHRIEYSGGVSIFLGLPRRSRAPARGASRSSSPAVGSER